MKYLMLLTTLITTSTHSIIGMDPYYKEMLGRIKDAAEGKPSVTLINNSPMTLCMQIGILKRDGIRSHMDLHKKAEFTFSPYAHPFYLKEEHAKRGVTVDFYTTRPGEKGCQHKPLLIGGISDTKFGDTVYINYNDNTLYFTHNGTNNLNDSISNIAHHNTERPKRASKTLPMKKRNSTK